MRHLPVSFLFLVFVYGHPATVNAENLMDCERARGDARVQACTRIIDTKRLSGKPISDSNLAIAYYNRGDAYRRAREHSRAVADFDMAIALNPAITLAYYHRGNVWRDQGRLNRAISNYDKTIELNPQYSVAYYNRARAYYDKGQIDRAAADYGKALELDRTLIHAWIALRRLGIEP